MPDAAGNADPSDAGTGDQRDAGNADPSDAGKADQSDAEPVSSAQMIERLADRWLGGPERFTGQQVAAMAGIDRMVTRRLWRAMGLADNPEDEAVLGRSDLDAVRRVAALVGSSGVSVADIVYLARVLGLATSQMADSVVGLQAEHLISRAEGAGAEGAEAEGAEAEGAGAEGAGAAGAEGEVAPDGTAPAMVVEELDELVTYLLHRHLLDALARRLPSLGRSDVAMTTAVGFADLVGYTALSQDLDESEIAALVERFEDVASDRVVAHGGRVVKMIGDAVMFSAPVGSAAEVALDLIDAFTSVDLPQVRVGMACGRVISRAGDLFGHVVNLASRATASARPGTVLVSPELAAELNGDVRYLLQRIRPRELKGIGQVSLSKLKRAEEGTTRSAEEGITRPPGEGRSPTQHRSPKDRPPGVGV